MQVNNFFIDLALRLLFIDLHFFIATIQIGVIVQVCYTPQARLLSNLFTSCRSVYNLYICCNAGRYERRAGHPCNLRGWGSLLAGGIGRRNARGKEASSSKTQECLLTCNRSSQKDGRKLDSKEVKQLTVPCNICRKQRLSLLWLRGAGFVYSPKTQVCWWIHRSGHCQGRTWQIKVGASCNRQQRLSL